MTKPIAILKDSIREAWDSKVLLVLIILSLLLALLLASIGYTAVPAETVYGAAKEDLRRVRLNRGNVPVTKVADFQRFNVTYDIKDFKTIESARNPANGRYSFTIAVTPGDPSNPVVSALDEGQPRRKDKDEKADPKDAKDKADKKDGDKKDGEKKEGRKNPFGVDEFDNFGQEVLLWHTDLAELIRKLQEAQGLSQEDQKKLLTFQLSDQMMVDFIRERLEYHYNVKVESVERTPAPLNGPQEFKVTTGPSDPRNWPHTVSLFFGGVSLEQMAGAHSLGQVVYALQNNLVNGVGAGLAIALGVIITSFFIPNMLRKGSVDLMLSKPITRPMLLVYKYIGGLSFMFIFAAVAVGSAWLVFGLRTGLWNPQFLILIPVLTFGFGILYAVSTLMAVLTRSAIASLLVTLAFNGLLWVVTYAYNQIDSARNGPMKEFIPGWVITTADIVHGVLPRTGDMDTITTKLIAEVMTENDRKKWESNTLTYPSVASVAVSLLWIAGCLGLACWRFSRKDY
jgi:ABC-type transport system involved in multi-copper enzyme maturation permease subunit